jgi:hypothetical protein
MAYLKVYSYFHSTVLGEPVNASLVHNSSDIDSSLYHTDKTFFNRFSYNITFMNAGHTGKAVMNKTLTSLFISFSFSYS